MNSNANIELKEQLAQIMQRLLQQTSRESLILPEFFGEDHEDPASFLQTCEERLGRHHVCEERYTEMVSAQLNGAAAAWWQSDYRIDVSWQAFREDFLYEYNNPRLVCSLKRRLYGQEQTINESAQSFLLKKRGLLRRLEPQTDELEALRGLTGLLNPELRVYASLITANTADEFLRTVRAIEERLPATPTGGLQTFEFPAPNPTTPSPPQKRQEVDQQATPTGGLLTSEFPAPNPPTPSPPQKRQEVDQQPAPTGGSQTSWSSAPETTIPPSTRREPRTAPRIIRPTRDTPTPLLQPSSLVPKHSPPSPTPLAQSAIQPSSKSPKRANCSPRGQFKTPPKSHRLRQTTSPRRSALYITGRPSPYQLRRPSLSQPKRADRPAAKPTPARPPPRPPPRPPEGNLRAAVW